MSKIVFYCHEEKSKLETFEYYKQDIDALKELGHQIIICTKYSEIPLKFDAMFIWWWTYAFLPVMICRLLNKPVIITGTFNFRFPAGFEGTDYFRRPFWQRILIKGAVSSSTLNLFVSHLENEACAKYFNLKSTRYYPHILHDDYLQGPLPDRNKILFNLAWSGSKNIIRKGIPELLQAVRILKDEGYKVSLQLAGPEGDGMENILGMIDELKINDEVRHLRMLDRSEKINKLRTIEIYVQPSHYEGFGVAIAEAMGCGACIITCDVGAVREVVGDCALYVSPNSPRELANAIKQVLSDTSLRSKFQEKAYNRAKTFFSKSRKLELLNKYLSEVGIS